MGNRKGYEQTAKSSGVKFRGDLKAFLFNIYQ